jgi:hypothetical protein
VDPAVVRPRTALDASIWEPFVQRLLLDAADKCGQNHS